MNKLPISIGILSWHSGQTLIDTLFSYYQNGLFDIVNDITILFQEVTDQDKQIANHFSLPYIGLDQNIGIGAGLLKLAENANSQNILLLEHDWKLVENKETTYERLLSGIDLLNEDFTTIKYRHREHPGYPLFTLNAYKGNELNHYDDVIDLISPHLLDSLHWLDPSIQFPDKIQKYKNYFITTSRWANWTNNPCMYKKEFYMDYISKFKINEKSSNKYNTPIGQITSEGEVSFDWSRQNFKIAQGEGLFKHEDLKKFGR